MYWRMGPATVTGPGAANKRDLWQLATSGQLPGLLVFDADLAVGWCGLAPRAELGWVARARCLEPGG